MSPTAGLTGVEGTAPYVARNPAAIDLIETAALDDESRPSGAQGRVRRPELRQAADPGGQPRSNIPEFWIGSPRSARSSAVRLASSAA